MSATDQPDFLTELSALIARHQEQAASQPEEPALMTPHDVARELQVSYSLACRMIHRSEIPGAMRVGRCPRVHRAAFDRWLAEQAQPEPVPFRRAG